MTGTREYWALRINDTGKTARVIASTRAGDQFSSFWVELEDQSTKEIQAQQIGLDKPYSWHEIDGIIDGWYVTVHEPDAGIAAVSMSREGWPSYTFAFRGTTLLHTRRPLGVTKEDEMAIGVRTEVA